ncbi:hypothetical protein PT931_20025 [Longispora urticae]
MAGEVTAGVALVADECDGSGEELLVTGVFEEFGGDFTFSEAGFG